MKNSLFLVTAIATLPTAMGLVGISWSVTNVPKNGLKHITFPFNIANATHETGYYFAQQFNFVGQADVGYTGLQPRPDTTFNDQSDVDHAVNYKATPIIHAVFSSFINGSTTSDSNCQPGADGGPGVSCSVEFSGSYAHTYHLEVVNTKGTTWSGTAVDAKTGKKVHIGSYTLPAGTQGVTESQVGFVEYYLWNTPGPHPCSTLPYSSVVFGVPTTTTKGAVGSLSDAYEYGNCVGMVGYESHRTARKGVEVSVGFK